MKKPTFFPKKNQGFALIATILLMVLLAIITIGTLSLSVVTVRNSGHNSAQNIARANARMALMMAIGELQRNTGSDTRVTAPANIVNPSNPEVLGVWRSWEGTDHELPVGLIPGGRAIAPLYSAKSVTQTSSGTGRFVNWLVSTAATKSTPNINDAPSLIQTTAGTNTIPLLAGGSLQATDTRQVHVIPTTLRDGSIKNSDANSKGDGRFAWWVSGENQKGVLGQPYEPRTDDAAGYAEMGQSHTITNPEVFGFSTLINDREPHHPSSAAAKPGRKAVSRQTMAVVQENNLTEPQKKFHDLSAYSSGLLTNTATGGWRKDLSILTERWDAIYASYPGGRLPLFRYTPTAGTTATTQVPKPVRPAAAVLASVNAAVIAATPAQSNLYPWSDYSLIIGARMAGTYHAASASWQSLVSYSTAYKNFTSSAGVVESPFVWDSIMSNSFNPTALQIYNYKHTQRLHPQIARFQFLVYARAIEAPVGFNPRRYQLSLMYVPVFTLWNPYSVGLTYTIPPDRITESLGFGWVRALPGVMAVVNQASYPGGPSTVPNNQYQLFTAGNFQYMDVGGNFPAEGYDQSLPQNIAKGYTVRRVDIRTFMASLPVGLLTFKPGEAKVFSPDGFNESYFGGTGMRLQPGFNPNSINGIQVGAGNFNATQRLWFLMKTDKLTRPFRSRNAGQGFSLGFGKTSGVPYGGAAHQLHKGVQSQFHNITSLASDTQGTAYWPSSEVDEVGYTLPELASGPWIPIFSINFGPRMTIGTGPGVEQNRPTKGVLQSNPLASMVLSDPGSGAAKDHPANGTFDITNHSLSLGSTLTPNLSTSKGFIGTGYQSGDGLSRLIMCDIPLRPMASLVELEGWNPRGNNPYPPFQSNLIGNSDATPLILKDKVLPPVLSPPPPPGLTPTQANLMHDDAYCANHMLFDDWFLSSIAPDPQSSKDINTVYREFLKGDSELVNRAYRPISTDNKVTDADATTRIGQMITSNDGWLKVASRFEVDGMFNVNSTSVEAWKALLGHAKSLDKIAMHGATGIVAADVSNKHVVTRGAIATDVETGSGPGFGGQFANASEYTGYRSLTDDQIEDLAKKIVEQVRLRGPFLSMSEFVNRQLSTNNNLALAGAIQSAINNLTEDPMATLRNPANSLSDTTMLPTDPKLAGAIYQFPESAVGSSAYGAPGWIRQADILRPIAPILTVRDDTFTIRAYGDSLDKNGNVVAQAWCEATVKRTREFCDPSDAADSIDPPTYPMNITFGRKFEIISFRWLNPDEV